MSDPSPEDLYRQHFHYATGLDEPTLLGQLESGEIDLSVQLRRPGADEYAQNALIYVCARGFLRTLKWLMRRRKDAIDPAMYSSKAFRMACSFGHTALVKILLRDGRSDAASRSNQAIIQASKGGHLGVVKLLVKRREVDPGDKGGQALLFASNFGNLEIVKVLMKHPRVDPSSMDFAAIRQAEAHGFGPIVTFLMRHKKMVGKEYQSSAV